MTRGEQLRRSIEAEYDVQGVPATTLVDAICRTADELALLEQDVDAHGVTIEGARGQRVANPALSAITRHRALLSKLIQEAFPDEHESVSERAARAARTRWRREGVRRA